MTDYKTLCLQLKGLIEGVPHLTANLANASALLFGAMEDINWAGFYLVENGKLVLGPFQGKPACIEIDIGSGVCGAAASQDRTQLVENVHLFPGHIACDSASNSEIVVPLHANGAVAAVLDIDSPLVGRFTECDRHGLEEFAKILECELSGLFGCALKSGYFAGGCFWCITPFFKMAPGVISVTSGYSGGDEIDPSYEDVKKQRTGHRETIKATYDPQLVSFEKLCDIFLSATDPFDADGQFIDRGRSYTLAVYYQSEQERLAAERKINALEQSSGKKVYVSLEPFKSFYAAGEEHQDYYLKNPDAFDEEMIRSGRKKS